jgi:hypothetical protein
MSMFTNLRAGNYSLPERVRLIFKNVGRKVATRKGCCGNYGDPGC